jgi:hypothetical protein
MYLEALLGLLGNERLGKDLYKKLDRNTNYEEKLRILGLTDSDLLKRCVRFREVRNDLIHEKSIDLESLGKSKAYKGQEEANLAVNFIRDIRNHVENVYLTLPSRWLPKAALRRPDLPGEFRTS